MSHRFLWPLILLALAACGGDDEATTAGAGGAGASGTTGTTTDTSATTGAGGSGSTASSTASTGAGGDLTTFDKTATVVAVQPGGEDTVCMTLRLDNPEPVYVRRFRAEIAEGSHHLIVYKSNDANESPTPTPCGGFSGLFSGDYPIFIAQQALSDLAFPTDAETGTPVAFKLEAQQMLQFELHYINTTAAPLDVIADVHFDTIPISETVIESDFSFWGTINIDIPPNSAASTPVKFQKALDGTKVFAVTTHQHQLGTRMRVWHATDKNDQSTVVADESDWANPALELFDPPLEFNDKKGLAYQCEWNNTTQQQVGFGEGFYDEMCFLWHYYYPSKGFQYCTDGLCQTTN